MRSYINLLSTGASLLSAAAFADDSSMAAETGMFSLADLAELNTDEITTLMSRLPEEGIFVVRGTEVKAGQNPPKEEGQAPLLYFAYQMEILQAFPLDKNKDPEDFVGKTLRERYTLWPKDIQEILGLLKGRYKTIGLENTGRLGGVEGQEPGWIDGIVSHVFKVRVRHWTGSNGNTNAQYDWMAYEGADSEAA